MSFRAGSDRGQVAQAYDSPSSLLQEPSPLSGGEFERVRALLDVAERKQVELDRERERALEAVRIERATLEQERGQALEGVASLLSKQATLERERDRAIEAVATLKLMCQQLAARPVALEQAQQQVRELQLDRNMTQRELRRLEGEHATLTERLQVLTGQRQQTADQAKQSVGLDLQRTQRKLAQSEQRYRELVQAKTALERRLEKAERSAEHSQRAMRDHVARVA